MKTLTLALAAVACVGLAMPAFGACDRYVTAGDPVRAAATDAAVAAYDVSAQKKSDKKKKTKEKAKDTTGRSTWGG